MLDEHVIDGSNSRLVKLFDRDVDSSYSYWFASHVALRLSNRSVRIFHDWLFETVAG
jgi:LysR family glycine cleavage system transcriptional activator